MAVALERSVTLSTLAPETRCLYDIYKKEGDDLYCKRRYKKALLSYNEALRLVQRNTQTLVARSRCYMGIGLMQKALDDAECALGINASYLPAIYQKAQIHYRQGNYEMALVTFNRGHKLNSSAPGFIEGMQKAQHAMDIMTSGRHMKTTTVGDLSLYLPKKLFRRHQKLEQSSFQVAKKSLPALPSLKGGKEQRVPSPGFRKRTGTLLLQVQKRRPTYLEQPRFGRGDLENTKVDDRAMKEILGQLYDDKEYFERILNSAGGQRDLSEMLSSVLESGLSFLYDRVLFWAQSGSLPPAPPHPTNVQALQWPTSRAEDDSSEDETERDEESDEDMVKVNEAIDAVSCVNGPNATSRRKRLKIRKRRADILKKRASVIVVPRMKRSKKSHMRRMEVITRINYVHWGTFKLISNSF